MPFSSRSKSDPIQQWFINNLPNARKNLKQFPILDKIFNGFSDFENKHHSIRKNVFIDLVFPDITSGNTIPSMTLLKDVEDALTTLDFDNMTQKNQLELGARITSNDKHASLSVFTELLVANKMISRFGGSQIKLHPGVGEKNVSDLLVDLGDKKLNLEITNLAIGLTEEKIQEIFDKVCTYLESKFSITNFYFKIDIDTIKLPIDAKKRINVDESIELLKTEIDRLNLSDLEGFQGNFSFDNVTFLLRCPNFPSESLNCSQKKLKSAMQQEPLLTWISHTSSELQKDSPITAVFGFIFKTNDGPLVEVHSEDFYPSGSSIAEKESFEDHLIRRIDEKVSGDQLHPDTVNVIVVQGHNWTHSHAEILQSDFEPIKSKINEYLEDKNSEILSGILYFSSDFDSGIFIPNPHCTDDKKLSSDDLRKLQFRLKPDHDF